MRSKGTSWAGPRPTLCNDYVTITSIELDQNILRIQYQWNPTTPIVTPLIQLEEAIVFYIVGNDNINEAHDICTSFTIITNTILSPKAIRNWRTQYREYCTRSHFQRDFIAAERDQILTSTIESPG